MFMVFRGWKSLEHCDAISCFKTKSGFRMLQEFPSLYFIYCIDLNNSQSIVMSLPILKLKQCLDNICLLLLLGVAS